MTAGMNRQTYHRLRRDAWRAQQAASSVVLLGPAYRSTWEQRTLDREADIARRSVPRPYSYAQDLFVSQQRHRRENVLFLLRQRTRERRRQLPTGATTYELRRALVRLVPPCVSLPPIASTPPDEAGGSETTLLAAALGSSLDSPPLPSVAAIPSSTPAAGEQPSCCPLPAVGVDSYMEISV